VLVSALINRGLAFNTDESVVVVTVVLAVTLECGGDSTVAGRTAGVNTGGGCVFFRPSVASRGTGCFGCRSPASLRHAAVVSPGFGFFDGIGAGGAAVRLRLDAL
jgi:hypothetical protein